MKKYKMIDLHVFTTNIRPVIFFRSDCYYYKYSDMYFIICCGEHVASKRGCKTVYFNDNKLPYGFKQAVKQYCKY